MYCLGGEFHWKLHCIVLYCTAPYCNAVWPVLIPSAGADPKPFRVWAKFIQIFETSSALTLLQSTQLLIQEQLPRASSRGGEFRINQNIQLFKDTWNTHCKLNSILHIKYLKRERSNVKCKIWPKQSNKDNEIVCNARCLKNTKILLMSDIWYPQYIT